MATARNDEWDESEFEFEIENWCLSLKPIEMNAVLGELELNQDGSRLTRCERLFRRLKGDYTAADFAHTEISEGIEDDESLRRIQVMTAIESANLSVNAKKFIDVRQRRRVARTNDSESILATPLANSTNNSNLPITSESAVISTREVAIRSDAFIYTTPTMSVGVSTVHTSVQTTIARTSMTDTTMSTTSLQGGIISTRETPSNETVRCQFPDGSIYEVRREVAIEIARLQAAVRNIDKIASAPTLETPEYNRLQRNLQSENAVSSTRLAAPQTRQNEMNANAQEFQPRIPTPAQAVRGESGGGGDSRVSQAYDTASSQRPPDLSALVVANKQWDSERTVRAWRMKFNGAKGSSVAVVKAQKPIKRSRPSVSAISEAQPENLAKLIEQLLDKKLKEHAHTLVSSKSKPKVPDKSVEKDDAPGKPPPSKQREKVKGRKKKSDRPPRIPASDKNKGKEAGPLLPPVCWGCSWPGYIRSSCPNCSGKEKGASIGGRRSHP